MKWEYEPKTNPTMYALHAMAQHWVENEKLIESAAMSEVERNGPKWTPNNDDEIGEFLHEKDEARMMHDEIMIPMHRYSCVVMLFTTIERELRRLTENLEKERGPQKLKVNDIKGPYLTQVTRHVEIFHGIRFTESPEFHALHDLQKLRDCIVHCLGEVGQSRDGDYLLQMQKKRSGFFAHPRSDIRIEAECIEEFLREAWAFFVWVFTVLDWKIVSFYDGRLEKTLGARRN